MFLWKGVIQHGLYLCIALCECLPSQGSLSERSIIVRRGWGRGCHGRGMQQVPTQGIANRVEKWSFVSLGED